MNLLSNKEGANDMNKVIEDKKGTIYPGTGWYSLNIHWWDSNMVLGRTSGNPGGDMNVWATGEDFADSVTNAIRHVEAKGHRVDQVTVNV